MTVVNSQRAPEAPREDLIRMTTTLRQEGDGSLLVGYAAVFNKWAEIDSWEGRFRERIAPGAFRKTLKERGAKVKVLFNHGMDPSIGDKPLGKPTVLEEDARGLKVEVPLDDTSYNADIRALLRSGALDGMSFRMTVVEDEWDKLDSDFPERTIKALRLYEFGPVTFPAYEATKAGVRAHASEAFEAWRSQTGAPRTTVPSAEDDAEEREEQDPDAEDRSADETVTDQQDENGPDEQATRSEQTDDQGEEPQVVTYQPAQPTPMSRERRQSQAGQVRAWAATARSE